MAAVHDDAITADTPLPPETHGARDEAPTTSTPLPPIEQPSDGFALSQVLRACRLRQTPLPPAVACYIVREVALARSQSVLGSVDTAQIALGAGGEVTVLESAAGVSGDERNALGRLLYECLVLRRVSGEEVTPPAQLIDSIPAAVDELVMRLLTEEGEDDDAALAAELEPLCAQLGGDREALRGLLVDLESALPQRAVVAEEAEIAHAETLVAKRATVSSADGAKAVRPASRLEATLWRWRWAITGAAALLAFVMPALLRTRRAAPMVPSVVTAPAPTPALTVPALTGDPVPASVRLRVGGPDGALVTVDDEPIGVLPLDVTLPGRAGVRRMVVTQPRHRPWLRTIPGSMDVAVVVELPANGPGAGVAPAAAAPAAPRKPVVVKNPYVK
jgi:hypothetical protein